jgi:hypothetical protein
VATSPAYRLRGQMAGGWLQASATFDVVAELDPINNCVSTPLGEARVP